MLYADIAFPAAVREVFTYHVPGEIRGEKVVPGIRAWVPLKGSMSIGMIVRVHRNKPAFKTRPVRKLLDKEPVLDKGMLRLTEWMHHFYYAGWGEVIQAALPAGLNFSSLKYLIPGNAGEKPADDKKLSKNERNLLEEVIGTGKLQQNEAYKRWGHETGKLISGLSRRGLIEIWEQPQLRVKPKTEQVWNLHPDFNPRDVNTDSDAKRKKWEQARDFLLGSGLLPATTAELTAFPECTSYTLSKLEQENILLKTEREVFTPEPDFDYNPDAISQLNSSQQIAFAQIKESIHENEFKSYLIYGITGSGKTEVYIHALKEALAMGKGGLVLVPEIALTPQTVRRFYLVFGSQIAILHSRLNDRERYDAWQALRRGEKTIAIGARSAIFAPVKNPGIIIIDEEHDTSYRQADPAPRYHAREVAAMRARDAGAVLVLGSATPGIVSLVNANRGKHLMVKLPSRHADAELPKVQILDLKQYRYAMHGPLAVPLYNAVCEAVAGGEQVILLYNRRGFASYMQCNECGHVVECPHCSVSLTLHKYLNQLRCHYCGHSSRVTPSCPSCGKPGLEACGSGTQQVEQELATILPDVRILRMDQDTTSGKNAHDKILGAFGRGEADILIGTQLVAKGLDFPNVTVVGVLNADTELAFPSYRSHERMYQLLSQVAGRSGRAKKKGRVFLQTKQPDHFTLKYAREHDYEGFARHELAIRKPLLYPPYGRLLYYHFKGKDGQVTSKVAHSFTQALQQSKTGYPILGPSPDVIMRMKDEFRWVTTVKLPADIKTGLVAAITDRAYSIYDKDKPDSSSTIRITVSHEMI